MAWASTGFDVQLAPGADPAKLNLVALQDGSRTSVSTADALPFPDRTLSRVRFHEAIGRLPVRDRLHVLLECRRCLAPGGVLVSDGTAVAGSQDPLARLAALVGFEPFAAPSESLGWRKRSRSADPSPLVSILIPAWNPRYFAETLDSALAQTHENIEILVGDDSARPEIETITRSRQGRVPIDYQRNRPRLGARRNYEELFMAARGEYIKFLNDDDLLLPDCVERLLEPFLLVPDLTLATSHRQRIDERARPIGDMPATLPVVPHDVIVNGVSLANSMVMMGLNFIGEPSTIMLRKRDFALRPVFGCRDIFHFNGQSVRGAIDMAMSSQALLQGDAAFLSPRLSCFRIHGEQAQAQPQTVQLGIEGIRSLQHQWIELGLFRRWHPYYLQTRRFLRVAGAQEEQVLQPLLSVQGSGEAPEDELRQWRATRRHQFDTMAPG